jgi:phospholipid/cholesterol/gamma-HCH transport system substrate-binding protein
MQLEYKKREKIVGLFVIVVVTLLVSTIIMIGRGQNWFKKYVSYYTTFNESYNLQPNAAVKLYKTDIGKVKKIILVKDRVRVVLEIFEEYAPRIRVDSVASVESPTFIGDEYVSITPGSKSRRVILEGEEVRSIEKKSLAKVLAEFEIEKTSKMMIEAFQDFSEIIKELRDPKGPLLSSLNHLNSIFEEIEAGRGTLGSVVKSRELIDSVIQRLDKVSGILNHVDQAAAKAPTTMDTLNAGLVTVEKAGNGVVARIEDTKRILAEVEELTGTLRVIIHNVEAGSRDVPQITQTTKVGIQEIREGVRRIDAVVQSVENNVLIRSNLPPEPEGDLTDAKLR